MASEGERERERDWVERICGHRSRVVEREKEYEKGEESWRDA